MNEEELHDYETRKVPVYLTGPELDYVCHSLAKLSFDPVLVNHQGQVTGLLSGLAQEELAELCKRLLELTSLEFPCAGLP